MCEDACMKTCFKCGVEKELFEFYAHPKMKDGHLNKCKDCTKGDTKIRTDHLSKTDPEWILREMDRQRLKGKNRRESGDTKPETKEQARIRMVRYLGKNPDRKRATSCVNNAVRDGRLMKKPCEVCGHPIVQAHHDDYSKPLDVRWLCVQHHNEHHIQERRKKVLERFQNSNGSHQQPSSQSLK